MMTAPPCARLAPTDPGPRRRKHERSGRRTHLPHTAKAVTVTQPLASLVVLGGVRWLPRPTVTAYRGPLWIVAARHTERVPSALLTADVADGGTPALRQARGAVVGLVELERVVLGWPAELGPPPVGVNEREHYWRLSSPRWLPEPVTHAGACTRALWTLDASSVAHMALQKGVASP